jgi:hypothetical protein
MRTSHQDRARVQGDDPCLRGRQMGLIRTAIDYLHFSRDGSQVHIFSPFEMRGNVYRYSKQRNSNEGRRESFRLGQKSRHELRKMSRGLKDNECFVQEIQISYLPTAKHGVCE